MFNPNDDDDLFSANASSNLASLFGSNTSLGIAQTDLKYTAPRQPRPKDLSSSDAKPDNVRSSDTQPKIAVICAKVVLATKLANNTPTPFGKLGFAVLGTQQTATEFLLYRDKQNVIAKATLTPNFSLREDENHLEFSDNTGVTWRAQFINDQDYMDFMKELQSRQVKITKQIKPTVPIKSTVKDSEECGSEDAQVRADILSRMAKMGQSVLPLAKANEVVENNGNDPGTAVKEEVLYTNPSKNLEKSEEKPQNSPKNFTKPNKPYQQPYYNPACFMVEQDSVQVQPYGLYQMYQNRFPQMQNNPDFHMFMSENRTHNTELRINLTSISTKIDSVLNELSKLKASPNTDRLENEFLKSKILDLEQQLQFHAKDDTSTQELKKKIMEQESLLKAREEKVRELDTTNTDLHLSLDQAQTKLSELDLTQKNESGLQKEIEDLTFHLNETTSKYTELENRFLELEGLHENLMAENKTLHDTNVQLSTDLSKENNKENIDVNSIKEVMNQMFQNILGDFPEGNANINYKEIKNALSKHMKQATFNIIDMLEKH